MNWIHIEDQGLVITARILVVGQAESAAMRRLLTAIDPALVVNLTGGHKRKSVIILDSGHAVITALPVSRIERALQQSVPTG